MSPSPEKSGSNFEVAGTALPQKGCSRMEALLWERLEAFSQMEGLTWEKVGV